MALQTELAGWSAVAQGAASILALILAFVVPWRIQKRVESVAIVERKLKARSLALALLPSLLEIQVEIERAKRGLEPLPSGTQAVQPIVVMANAEISVPPIFRESRESLYLLGDEAGSETQQLLAVLDQYERMFATVAYRMSTSDTSFVFSEACSHLLTHVGLLETLVRNAINKIEPIHDGDKRRSGMTGSRLMIQVLS